MLLERSSSGLHFSVGAALDESLSLHNVVLPSMSLSSGVSGVCHSRAVLPNLNSSPSLATKCHHIGFSAVFSYFGEQLSFKA